jgi:hypothetical protein
MHKEIQSGILKGSYHLGDLGIDGRIILKCTGSSTELCIDTD